MKRGYPLLCLHVYVYNEKYDRTSALTTAANVAKVDEQLAFVGRGILPNFWRAIDSSRWVRQAANNLRASFLTEGKIRLSCLGIFTLDMGELGINYSSTVQLTNARKARPYRARTCPYRVHFPEWARRYWRTWLGQLLSRS